LSLAKVAKKAGVPVFYFICPQVWAWRTGRVRKMKARVDRLVVVFPFELDFYHRHGLSADFVGHPLLDVMGPPRPKGEVKAELGFDPAQPLLLLMPGSRKHLVKRLFPIMLETAGLIRREHPEIALAVAQAETLQRDFLERFLDGGPEEVRIVLGTSHALQNAADAAIVASGTSTLETALMLTPMVVVYRASSLSFALGQMLVKVEDVAMANLIAGRRVVPELLQNEARPDRIAAELEKILKDPEIQEDMIRSLKQVREKLGRPGACRRAARLLLQTIEG
ncbi:MAG: lipid-A-disaccharide synthase, partial [Pseudomonadota bacterium]